MGSSLPNEIDAQAGLFDPVFPTEWARYSLYSLATWTNGLAFKAANFSSAGLPIIKIAEIKSGITAQTKVTDQEFPAHVKVEGGDLLFSWSGQPETSIDAYWWSGPTGWLNQHIFRVEPRDGIDRQFFYYLLKYLRPSFIAIATNKQTTGLGHVTKRDLQAMQVGVPDVKQQQLIASVLGALDARIEILRQANATLEAIAQALFTSWFVNFDPVRAKAEGREPDGIDAATAALFPGEFEDCELGLIPKGWKITNVGAIAELIKGCSYKGAGLSEAEGAYMFNLGCFSTKRVFATENIKRYTERYRERQSVAAGDLIMANTDMTQHREILGRPLLVPAGYEPGFVSHHVFKVAVQRRSSDQWKRFLFFAFQQPAFRVRAVGHATGTTVLALAKDSAEGCPIIEPSEEIHAAFDAQVAPLLARIARNLEHAKTLRGLRDTLLPRLISGKLLLPEAAALAEDALA